MRVATFLLAIGLGLVAPTSSGADELIGELNMDGDSVYEGYAYATYRIEVSGNKLSVSMNASGLDAYLILHSPEAAFLQDDDGGEGNNARIEVLAPVAGPWIVIATSLRTSGEGRYSVVTEGAVSVARIDPAEDLVEAAFLARGVTNQERQRARKVQMLKEHLAVRSFRQQLIEDLSREVVPEGLMARERYWELEALERELDAALDEAAALRSRDLVRDLLEKKLSSTRDRLTLMSDAIEERVKHREAYAIALNELRALHGAALELYRLEESLLAPERGEDIDIRRTRLAIAWQRAAVGKLAENIAARLVESSFIRWPSAS